MKRVQSACLTQTLHFILDPSLEKEEAIKRVEEEVVAYKNKMESMIKVLREEKREDGTIIIEVKKKVSGYSVGKYFD